MQTQSQEFRAQATECQELADHSRELMKEQYEQLVGQWLFLAEQAKSREELPNEWPRGNVYIIQKRIAATRPLPNGNSGQFRSDPRT